MQPIPFHRHLSDDISRSDKRVGLAGSPSRIPTYVQPVRGWRDLDQFAMRENW
jgi:hypothetical protein